MDYVEIARKALASLRRRGLRYWMDPADLASIGVLAALESGATDEALAVTVARHAIIDAIRKGDVREDGRVQVREGHAFTCGGEDPSLGDMWDATVYGGDSIRPAGEHYDLWEGIRALAPRDYQVVAMYFWGGMGQVEIAESLGVDQSTVSRVLAAALKKVQGVLHKKHTSNAYQYEGEGSSAGSPFGPKGSDTKPGFQFPERGLPPSMNPAPNMLPIVLVRRETADIPPQLSSDDRERIARRITRRVLDAFWLDMGAAHFSAAMQICPTHPLHHWYAEHARRNRERLAAAREAEQAERARMIAAA